jgi:AraC family transcriptional regulator, regulatory protein of adaptative response / methylated-DNA-[protein]-cysteine methyltransferase
MKTTSSTSQQPGPASYSSYAQRWNAVVRRDARADGQFCFSVKTTGVYCRPSCKSRHASRSNVQFHESCEAAERAGFRACKRCQPNGPSLPEVYAARVAAACRTIETAQELPSLDWLAKAASMSRFHFHRVFTQVVGLTPKAYAVEHRAERVRNELAKRDTITEAIYDAGYNSNGRFYAESSQLLGMAPKAFRSGGSGETIRFAIRRCSLGRILVAASDKGVCAISLGDDADRLKRELCERFASALVVRGNRGFGRLVAKVVSFVEKPRFELDLPLDVRGTAFQRRVWRALQTIPFGSTLSYGDLAKGIGAPRAARAVASACAANTLAIAIPCHRVLRASGQLSGYRWGVERKRRLLKREQGGG